MDYDFIFASTAATLAVAMLLTLIFWYLYRQDCRRCFGLWALALGLVGVRAALLLIPTSNAQAAQWLHAHAVLVSAMAGVAICLGVLSFIGRRLPWWWWLGPVAVAWLTLGGNVLELPRALTALPEVVLLAVLYCYSGWLLQDSVAGRQPGPRFLFVVFVIVSVYRVASSMLLVSPAFAAVEPYFTAVFGMLIVFSILRLSFESIRTDAGLRAASWQSERLRADEERERLRQQFLQSQKMEALGLLAGGVAHDINNVLSAIMGVSSLLERRFQAGTAEARQIETVLSACARGRDLTRNLLGFARKGVMVKEQLSLNTVVQNVVQLLSATLPKRITLNMKVSLDLPAVEGDVGQLEQMLMNLCLNAADAIHESGTITLSTQRVLLGTGEVPAHFSMASGPAVALVVEDDGVGMEQLTVERAFEPFFTTKLQGRGTGLGLAMVYGTVSSHSGAIELRSTPGHGTRAIIYLPALADEVSLTAHGRPPSQLDLSGCRVLVVDDEAVVRDSIGSMLLEFGTATVLTAAGGEEAVEALSEQTEGIQLVLLDLAMPGLDGKATYGKLRALAPTVPVLFMSGYSNESLTDLFARDKRIGFLQKPFNLPELAAEIDKFGA